MNPTGICGWIEIDSSHTQGGKVPFLSPNLRRRPWTFPQPRGVAPMWGSNQSNGRLTNKHRGIMEIKWDMIGI